MNNRIKIFLPALVLYFLGSGIVWLYAVWYVHNPDTFQYISIARKYLSGDFTHALNAYWSPLFSWLLILPLSTGYDEIMMLKILQVLIGGFTLILWTRLVFRTGLTGAYRMAVCYLCIPFLWVYTLLNPTPDLLFLTLVLVFLNQLLQDDWLESNRSAILCGITGALLYFAKAFGFPFFIAAVLLAGHYAYSQNPRPGFRKNSLLALVVFITLTIPWIIAISWKYGSVTISKSAGFNMTKEVAQEAGKTVHLPVLSNGLLAPPDKIASSAWESPGEAVLLHPVHPFSSATDFSYYMDVVKRNLLTIWYYDFQRQAGMIFLIVLFIFGLSAGPKLFYKNKTCFLLLLVIFLFYVGYSLVLVHTRYLWINTWLMILLVAILTQEVMQTGLKKRISRVLFLCILFIAVKRPVKEILFSEDKNLPLSWFIKTIGHPFETMANTYRPERNLHAFAMDLKRFQLLSGNLASLQDDSPNWDYYTATLFIASYSRLPYYGQLNNSISFEEQIEQLKKNKIDYFFVWHRAGWKGSESRNLKPLIKNPWCGVSLYKLDEAIR